MYNFFQCRQPRLFVCQSEIKIMQNEFAEIYFQYLACSINGKRPTVAWKFQWGILKYGYRKNLTSLALEIFLHFSTNQISKLSNCRGWYVEYKVHLSSGNRNSDRYQESCAVHFRTFSRRAAFSLWYATKSHKQKTLISPRFIYDLVRFGVWCFHKFKFWPWRFN